MTIKVENLQQCLQLPKELPRGLTVSAGDLDIERVTRYLPNRRLSGVGSFKGNPAFVKIYYHPSGAEKEYLKEKTAAEILINHKLDTPTLLGSGDHDGVFWLAFELLDNPKDLNDYWQTLASDRSARQHLFGELLKLNFSIYQAGFIQADPHLGNFVFSNQKIYVVDAGGIRKITQNSETTRLNNLGLLIAQFPVTDHQFLVGESFRFISAHSDYFGETTQVKFESLFLNQFRKRLRRFARKVLRDCTQIQHIQSRHLEILCQRNRYQVLADSLSPKILDEKIKAAPLLKDGGTATVARLTLGGREIIVKRYNYLGFFSALRRSLKASRARRSWVGGHLLQALQIDTPAPIAMLEEKCWYGVRRAYILNERVDGETALDYYLETAQPDPEILTHFDEYFAKFHAARISHGDMKATNFIVSDEKLNVIDLDSIVFHKRDKSFAKAIKADYNRLLKNWQGRQEVLTAFKAVCERYTKL